MYITLTKTCKILHYWFHNMCMFIGPILLQCVLKKCWCYLPEDGETIAPKHEEATWKIIYFIIKHKINDVKYDRNISSLLIN
jgi:hypothetical protein